VSVLFVPARLEACRAAAEGPLRELADSLAADLERVLSRELVVPAEKARMTRSGGRCERDGTLLEFDPFSPRVHRCSRCGSSFTDDAHHRWWIMGYQLWLAERAVHAAALYAVRGDARHREFARSVLERYVEQYLGYPNKDNVLGPTRVFFSTYLESIWLLQLIVALDLLEMTTPEHWHAALGAAVRERVIAPSAELIRGYDEGLSNRQVWNNAALLAASRSLDARLDSGALSGPSGLIAHLTTGLLGDGTWYEGENYHLFAHRGLWYGVTIAQAAGAHLAPRLVARFGEAFVTPFLTALPDFTFPSRRDSQYRVSLRQWRFAELAELGHVRQPDDPRLRGALATLYDDAVPRHDTGRARSTAEAERNTPATSLTRADLGWRSLLFANPSLPPLVKSSPGSVILRDQGLAILRREHGALYAALDYGHSGAGHGHPDRLNFVLVRGHDRWLDDVGTGSYVDPSLHWYRSTLAHNAPLVNGRSQQRVHGALAAYEERGAAGWVRAFVDGVAPGVRLERTIVAMPDYVVDELTWRAAEDVQIDLPMHVDGTVAGAGPWRHAIPAGGTDVEDGFRFLTETETAPSGDNVTLGATLGASTATVRVFVDATYDWWRAVSIGAPGSGPARFHFVRARGRRGTIVSVWDLTSVIANATRADGVVTVTLCDGTRHEHRSDAQSWHVALVADGATSSIDLAGNAEPVAPHTGRPEVSLFAPEPRRLAAGRPVRFELGEREYRRSEQSWREAGRPVATVWVAANSDAVVVTAEVVKSDLSFAPACETNALDNENPDTNSDGVQLHVIIPASAAAATSSEFTWVMVPEAGTDRVRITSRATGAIAPKLRASWHVTERGYAIVAAVPRAAFSTPDRTFRLGVIVNETSPDRERRRGQLVLGGADGEFVYLRGDRLAADRHLAFVLADE